MVLRGLNDSLLGHPTSHSDQPFSFPHSDFASKLSVEIGITYVAFGHVKFKCSSYANNNL